MHIYFTDYNREIIQDKNTFILQFIFLLFDAVTSRLIQEF